MCGAPDLTPPPKPSPAVEGPCAPSRFEAFTAVRGSSAEQPAAALGVAPLLGGDAQVRAMRMCCTAVNAGKRNDNPHPHPRPSPQRLGPGNCSLADDAGNDAAALGAPLQAAVGYQAAAAADGPVPGAPIVYARGGSARFKLTRPLTLAIQKTSCEPCASHQPRVHVLSACTLPTHAPRPRICTHLAHAHPTQAQK